MTRQDPTAALASFVANLSPATLPDQHQRLAERAVLDTVGVTLAGLDAPATAATRRALAPQSEAGAAFVAGTAGHALDFDDVCLAGMDGHPSVTMVAPALLAGDAADATGADLLAAHVGKTLWGPGVG